MNKNIAFHFNPRYKEKTVIRNTMPGFSWGREEKSQPEFPFLPGKHFDIIILVEKEEYKVLSTKLFELTAIVRHRHDLV